MTSGEWDLRALKALEEEEQKEFLALSQKSLFEPPSPPPQAKQINAQHLIHSALTERERCQQPASVAATAATATCNSSNYMQLQAQQLLKLPTINEHHNHQYFQKHKTKSSESGGGRLKFTKVLSLSAHSLTNRFSGGISGVGGGLKKTKKASGSNSPSNYASPSPIYTPPPTRRCNTLHHSQPQARKAFKTLQQLEKQKQERKQEALNKNRTLQRIAGTNKTYWKYGIHSTANSITQQHQQKLQQRKSITSELESNTSDELGSEETQPIDNVQLLQEEREHLMESQNKEVKPSLAVQYNGNDDDDVITEEIGSCSVPLASDSMEMMSIMLTAASTAVKTQPSLTSLTAGGNPPPPDIAATSVGIVDNSIGIADFPKYFTLNHHNLNGTSGAAIDNENEETVAYKAFHNMLSRRKSFAGEKLLRAQTLQRNSSLQHDVVPQQQQKSQSRNANNRVLLKSSSVDAHLSSYLDFNINSTTIITNPLITNIKSNKQTPTTMKSVKTSCLSRKKLLTPAALLTIPHNNGTSSELNQQHNQECNQMCATELHHQLHQQQHHLHVQNSAYHSQHLQAQHLHHLLDGNELNTSSSLIIDDELEEHIKQCSCSCNHMGYGNSMDYQRYRKVDYSKDRFNKSFANWLKNELSVQIASETTNQNTRGRPQKSLDNCSDRPKRRKLKNINEEIGYENIQDTFLHQLRSQKQLTKVDIIEKVVKASPLRTKRIRIPTPIDAKQFTNEEELALFLDLELTKQQYIQLRLKAIEKGSNLYPAYHHITAAKLDCLHLKDTITVTPISAEVQLQSLLDHTAERLLQSIKGNELKKYGNTKLILFCKWGRDGFSGQKQYKQVVCENISDSDMFMVSFVPLRLKKMLEGSEPLTSTTQTKDICRPIKFEFKKETHDAINKEVSDIKAKITTLQPLQLDLNGQQIEVSYKFVLTMIDGKVDQALTNTKAASSCIICHATSSQLNQVPTKS